MPRTEYVVGADLGQSQDFTALATLQRVELKGDWNAALYCFEKITTLRLRHLERVPLGTTYPMVVDRVRDVVKNPALWKRCQLAVDATGVGRVMVDLLRQADLDCQIWPVNITGGLQETLADGYYGVPKRDLIVGLQVLLQNGGLQVANGLKEGPTFVKELAGMRVQVTSAGREQFGNSRESEHDDLVLAVALAAWLARRLDPGVTYGDHRWWQRQLDLNPDAAWLRRAAGLAGEERRAA